MGGSVTGALSCERELSSTGGAGASVWNSGVVFRNCRRSDLGRKQSTLLHYLIRGRVDGSKSLT